ncbi:Alpha/Beta hydrolase protein [Colletotrichum cereale]|nr:Alpha/Beta hydrolase protein [Colletotrichum cereale]
MDLSTLTKKTIKVSRGFTYTYYTSPAQGSRPTLILFHGWPDTARLWAGLINDHLLPQGYGIIALDTLGYGGSSKPIDEKAYAYDYVTADIVSILDAEGIGKVISLGHDWGSLTAQRLYNFHPARVCGVVIVNVTYNPPTGHFDLDETIESTKKAFGRGIFEYWRFFTAEDAVGIMNRNLESVYAVGFGEPETWLETFCTPDGMRRFISEGRTQPTLPFATPEHKADFMERFSKDEDGGFAAPSCMYKAMASGIQAEADKNVAEEAKTVKVPVLYWGGTRDFVCRPEMLQKSIDDGLLPDVKSVTRDGGHWACLEKPDEFGQDVVGWLQERFA